MAGVFIFARVSVQVFVACLAFTQGSSNPLCSGTASTCSADTEILAAVSEHSSSDHVLYVQKKVHKIGDDPSVAEQALAKAAEGHDNHESEKVHYEPPPPNEFDDGYSASATTPAPGDLITASYSPISWAYVPKADGVKGPWEWAETPGFEACGSDLQSPVNTQWKNLKRHSSLTVADLELKKMATDCNMTTEYILNAYTAEMVYPGPCGRTFVATWKGKEYYLAQFNYHSPSEHTIDGSFYPMEVHHLHKADDGQILIIAVFVAQQRVEELHNSQERVAYDFMNNFLQHVPKPTDDHNNRFAVMYESEMWDAYDDFLTGHLGDYFLHYVGSITTPPCTTGTVWILDPIPINIPFTLIHKYRELINQDHMSQLAPFGTIQQMGPHVVPHWAPDAGMDDSPWHAELKCDTRPVQRMDGRTVWIINTTTATWTTPEPLPGEE